MLRTVPGGTVPATHTHSLFLLILLQVGVSEERRETKKSHLSWVWVFLNELNFTRTGQGIQDRARGRTEPSDLGELQGFQHFRV